MSLFAELKRRNVIRVVAAYVAGAWLLIQVADTVFDAFGLPASAMSILITVLAIGLLPVAAASWAFELTPEGLKRDADVAQTGSAPAASGKRLDRIIIAVLGIGIAFFAFDKFVLDPSRDARIAAEAEERGRNAGRTRPFGDRSIAVLPFADFSPAGDQAYFSDGMAEELLNLLAKVQELRVISRSSAFRFRGDDVHVPTVAAELGVAYVLQGSVRKSGNDIRVTAQLVDAETDANVWSESFDRKLDDVFAVQDEISQAIVDELQIQLVGAAPSTARTDPETYAMYLQAIHRVRVQQIVDDDTESLLAEVLERQPDYVPALNTMVAVIFFRTGDDSLSKYSLAEGIPLMREYVDRVLAIDPENSKALAHRSWMAFFYSADLETSAAYISRALRRDPADPDVLHIAGVISRRLGRNDDAIRFGEAALLRDPLCSNCLYSLMLASIRGAQYEKALSASKRRMQVAPGGWITRGNIHLLMGDPAEALKLYENQEGDLLGVVRARVIALHEIGDIEARDEALAELETFDGRRAAVGLAEFHAWIGDLDEAFAWLERAVNPESPEFTKTFTGIIWNPFLKNLRDDLRWLELRRQANLGPERLEAIRIEMP